MTNRTAVVVQHVSFEDPGLLDPLLAERGYRVSILQAGIDPIEEALLGADLAVLLGGPIGVHDGTAYPFIEEEIRLVAERLSRGGPTLGVCLGGQIIARALGAEVEPAGPAEIGYAPVTLTSAGAESVLASLAGVPVLHWHADQFRTPEGALRLAETEACRHQAFAVGTGVLALQFHLEADHRQIERWLIGHAHELAARGIDPREIREQARRHGPALRDAASAALGSWLDGLPDPVR